MNLQAPAGHEMQEEDRRAWCVRARYRPLLEPLLATPLAALRRNPALVSAGAGRSGAFHIPVPGADSRVLIRPYARGGILARWLPAGFRDLSRGFTELETSARAEALELPVAGAVAVSGEKMKSGKWDMAAWSWWVPDAPSLVERLRAARGKPDARAVILDATAHALLRCHDAGLNHRDLNAHNVIVRNVPSSPAALLVDLDRARFAEAASERMRLAQLRRLYRSLVKTGIIPANMPSGEYARLVTAYFGGQLDAKRLADFMRGCRAQAFRHSLLWKRPLWTE